MNATSIQQLWDQKSVAAKEIYVTAARAENEAADMAVRVLISMHASLLMTATCVNSIHNICAVSTTLRM